VKAKTISWWIAAALVLGVTVGAGVTQGLLTNRWGPRPSMVAAAGRLQRQMPPRIGNWVLREEGKLQAEVQETLHCAAYLWHTYEHVETGDRVSVFVVLGPHGPIAVHTPEICFSSQNHRAQGERQMKHIDDAKGNKHKLWELYFKANDLEAADIRVMYAWSSGGPWQATESPRFAFAGAPYLYKIQLSGPPRGEASSFDACSDFLREFLAQLQQRLAEPATTISERS
jgi:hypothetical protein